MTELRQEAKGLGFISRINLVHENLKSPDMGELESCLSYLWMCELQKWLREKHNIYIEIEHCYHIDAPEHFFEATWHIFPKEEYYYPIDNKQFDSYEDALELALCEALKLIK